MSGKENTLIKYKHILISLEETDNKDYDYLKKNFCGLVITNLDEINSINYGTDTLIYMIGDIKKIYDNIQNKDSIFYVIKDFSYNYDNNNDYEIIDLGKTPINVHNLGVLFRNMFDCSNSEDYFDLIQKEHKFQELTESNKKSNAFRKGIYLSKVEKDNDEIKFNLLRCSSNLNGPTDNFRKTDNKIINKVNSISSYFFEQKVEFNHVLAQIYFNKKLNSIYLFFMWILNYIFTLFFNKPFYNINTKNTQKKAKIKSHSDKTKDMPREGLIAFCTFYKSYFNNKFNEERLKDVTKSKDDPYDYHYQNTSVLTKLHFRLKPTVKDSNLVEKFTITLYPNSVFMIPLSTNRLYTHEIRPSPVNVNKIPTRMGYVVRCSNTKAVYKNNQTYIVEDSYKKLERISDSDEKIRELRNLYYKENTLDDLIDYGKIYFSMNNGDYLKPIL